MYSKVLKWSLSMGALRITRWSSLKNINCTHRGDLVPVPCPVRGCDQGFPLAPAPVTAEPFALPRLFQPRRVISVCVSHLLCQHQAESIMTPSTDSVSPTLHKSLNNPYVCCEYNNLHHFSLQYCLYVSDLIFYTTSKLSCFHHRTKDAFDASAAHWLMVVIWTVLGGSLVFCGSTFDSKRALRASVDPESLPRLRVHLVWTRLRFRRLPLS